MIAPLGTASLGLPESQLANLEWGRPDWVLPMPTVHLSAGVGWPRLWGGWVRSMCPIAWSCVSCEVSVLWGWTISLFVLRGSEVLSGRVLTVNTFSH